MQPAGLKHILGNPKADRKKSTSQKAQMAYRLTYGEKNAKLKVRMANRKVL